LNSSEVLGLRSRFASRSAVSPAYAASDFVPWLRGELLLLCFNPRIRSDLHFRGDRMLCWRAARQFARSFFGRSLL
jgi:hypothetical protein